MVRKRLLADSEHEVNDNDGLLFRIAARVAVLVFVGVLAYSLNNGMDPSLALLRSLAALLGVTSCGWLAEQAVRMQPPAPASTGPAKVETLDLPAATDTDSAAPAENADPEPA